MPSMSLAGRRGVDQATIASAFETRYRAVFAKPLTGIAIRIRCGCRDRPAR